MTEVDRQVRKTQVRLWGNRWLRQVCWTTTVVAAPFAVVVLISKFYGLDWPLPWIAGGLALGGLLASLIWSLAGRPDRHAAAAALDEAAGLRERVSSGLYCTESTDPWEQAVVEDAQAVAGSVSVGQHIRLRFPTPAVYTAIALLVAGALLLLPEGLLERSEARERRELARQVERTKVEVRKQLNSIKRIAETNPALEDLKQELEKLEQEPPGKLMKPQDIRREAVKKVDKLADALREQRSGEKFDQVREMKKMLRRIRQQNQGATQKLSKALAKGDFKGAREEIKDLQDMLATLKQKQDQEMVKQLQNQLKALAKQLDNIADDKQLREKLEQAGVKQEDVERMLKNLSKKDLDQLQNQLQKNGLPQKQTEKLLNQLQARRQACNACKNMSQAMSNAASSAAKGDMEGAAGDMQAAGDQLSEMEQLEQEMNQLDSQLASLQNAKNEMGDCPQCKGTGMSNGQACGKCQGSGMGGRGTGMGKLGQGRGGLTPEDGTSGFGSKIHRQKVHTGKGRIIGQFLVDGEQVKGGVTSEFAEAVAAEERDATDAINRDRIPRQYQKSVKEYFSYVQKALSKPGAEAENEKQDTSTTTQDDAEEESGD